MFKNQLTNITKLILLLFAASIICSCSKSVEEGMIIFNEIPQSEITGNGIWDFVDISRAKLMAFNPEKKDEATNLSKDFFSATSPQISYDGTCMLFAAKKEAESPWQIWEMELRSSKVRQITSFDEDCVSPAYLPGRRLIFSRLLTNNSVKTSYVLFNGNLDGTCFKQVTFSPQSYTATTVLNEGRALSTRKQVYPEKKESKIMVFRPDGTKIELLYKAKDGYKQISKAKESDKGQILFAEYNTQQNKSEIVALNYSNPAKGRNVLSSELKGEFYFAAPYLQNTLLTSYSTDGTKSVLCQLNPETNELNELLKAEGRIIDAVVVEAYERPRNLPSDVNPDYKTGLLVCQDVNFLGLKSVTGEATNVKASKVEILGVERSLGLVDVEADGSFYLKIDADVPFRIQTLSAEGEVVNGPGSWYFIRPNERRGCVGCHTGPDISPFNRQPFSVQKEPVIIHK